METRIVTVNNVDIVASQVDGKTIVPIKPICTALGVDRKVQSDKIKSDPILSSVGVLSTLTGADGKQYEMFCLPLEYIFGWLFTINPSNKQIEKIRADEFLSAVETLRVSTGADGKRYEMVCLPLRYVFGWLFSINAANVKEDAKSFVSEYKMQCYDILYDHFEKHRKYHEWRNEIVGEQIDKVNQLRSDFNQSRKNLYEATSELERRRAVTEDDYFGTLFVD